MKPAVNLQIPNATDGFMMRLFELKEAKCPDTGAYLRRSRGNRMAGRKSRWWAVLGERIERFTAETIEEAVEKGNKRLNRERA
jgi:hypothetical protein